ncbi:MAG: hypothetical protein IJD53_01320 [Alistipes sp.]|nr:hypothetical protein [Alistipes sp.]
MDILNLSSKAGYLASQVDRQTGASDTIFGFLAEWWWVLLIIGVVIIGISASSSSVTKSK